MICGRSWRGNDDIDDEDEDDDEDEVDDDDEVSFSGSIKYFLPWTCITPLWNTGKEKKIIASKKEKKVFVK